MKNQLLLGLGILTITLMAINFVYAVSIEDVRADTFNPGQEGNLIVTIENNFDSDVKDVSLELSLANLPFTPVGSSTSTADEIKEDDDERFGFRLRASNDAALGDYKIPYVLKYELNGQTQQSTGVFGIKVSAEPEIDFLVDVEKPVIGQKTKLDVKIINKGFGEIKFVSVKIFPEGYTILSDSSVYIGNIDSDDFETAGFDVSFTKERVKIKAIIEYRNFENDKVSKEIEVPVKVYAREEAISLGIIERNNTFLYVGILVLLIIIWGVARIARRKRRLAKSRGV